MFYFEKDFDNLRKRLDGIKISEAFPAQDIEKMGFRLAQLETESRINPDRIAEFRNTARAEFEKFLDGRTPKASFHVVSDVHVAGKTYGTENWAAALEDMKNIFPESNIALVSAGDLSGGGAAEQFEGFYETFRAHAPVCDEKVLFLLGNHDVRGCDSSGWSCDPKTACKEWPEERERYISMNAPYMPQSAKETLYFSKELSGYTFLMFNTTVGIKDSMHMTDEMIDWFESKMKSCCEKDPNKPVFIISHQALNNTHWRSNVLDGFDGIGNEIGTGPYGKKRAYSNNADERVKEIMAKYPVGVFFSGHIHNQFGMVETQPREYGVAVDIPSFGYPEIGISEVGTGYETEIFDNQIVFRARNFAAGHWLPEYDTFLSLPLVCGVLKRAKENCDSVKKICAVKEAEKLMNAKYDQEGMPWDWSFMPKERLFSDSVLEKIEELRGQML